MLDPIEQLRDMFGIAQAVKSERKQQAAQHTQFVRSLTLGFVDLYNNAPSLAYKQHYQEMLQGISERLPETDRAAIAPYLTGTPLDPIKMKRTKLEQIYGPAPALPTNFDDNPHLYASIDLQREQREARIQSVLSGKEVPIKKVKSYSNGNVALRKADGSVDVMTVSEFEKSEEAREYGMDWGQFVMQDGEAWGKPVTMWDKELGKVEVTARYDIVNKRKLEPRIIPAAGNESWNKQPQQLSVAEKKWQTDIKLQLSNQKGDIWDSFEKQVIEGGLDPNKWKTEFVDEAFPGMVTRIMNVEAGSRLPIVGDYFDVGEQFRLLAIKGVMVPDPSGDPNTYLIWDADSQKFYDPDGQELAWQAETDAPDAFAAKVFKENRAAAEAAKFRAKNPGYLTQIHEMYDDPEQAYLELSAKKLGLDPEEYPELSTLANAGLLILNAPDRIWTTIANAIDGTILDREFIFDMTLYFMSIIPRATIEVARAAARSYNKKVNEYNRTRVNQLSEQAKRELADSLYGG